MGHAIHTYHATHKHLSSFSRSTFIYFEMADESPADVTSQEETSQEEGIIELSSADTPAQTQATSSNTEGGPEVTWSDDACAWPRS